MNFEKFKILAKKYKIIPVYKRIIADLLTPISAYMRLAINSTIDFAENGLEK